MAAQAALPPPGGGLPPHQTRSFAEALKSSIPSHLNPSGTDLFLSDANHTSAAKTLPPDAHRLGSHKGSPAIYFKSTHIQNIVKPYHWTLIGKFSHGFNKQDPSLGRPPVEELVLYFKALDLKSEVQLGLLDNRHVLIQIQHYDDFLRLYSRPVWYVQGKPMRIFKWTSSFHVDREAPFAPVWLSFPRLPIHFFEKLTLMAIASLLGTPLRLDAPTLALKRPSIARVQVEIDLLTPRVEKIWIGVDEGEGFWQNVAYADVPDFCQHCNHVGHSDVLCHVRNPDLRVPALRKTTEPQRAGRDKHPPQRFVPTGRQADPSGYFAVADASTSAAVTVAPPPATDVPQPSHSEIIVLPPQSKNTEVPPAGLSPEEGVQAVLVADDDALLHPTQASTAEALQSNDVSHSTTAELPPQQRASNIVNDASVGISTLTRAKEPVPPAPSPVDSSNLPVGFVDTSRRPSVVDTELLPAIARGVHVHGTVDEQLHGPVHQQCPSDIEASQQQFLPPVPREKAAAQHKPPDVSAFLELVPRIGQPQIEDSPPVTTSNVLYTVSNSIEDVNAIVPCGVVPPLLHVALTVPPKEHVPAAVLNPYAPAFQSPTPSEAYGSKSPIIHPPILHTLPSRQHVHPFMGHDIGYNDDDYYQDSFGADEFGIDDEGATDANTYDDITDGSEGAHSRKKKDRRKLKGSASTISATKEELNEQSRLLGIRIRNRGRPPGSRNRTYFGMVRTMETRASKSTSN